MAMPTVTTRPTHMHTRPQFVKTMSEIRQKLFLLSSSRCFRHGTLHWLACIKLLFIQNHISLMLNWQDVPFVSLVTRMSSHKHLSNTLKYISILLFS